MPIRRCNRTSFGTLQSSAKPQRNYPSQLRDANPTIPWRQIIDMRNIVVHVYHGINWRRVFETAQRDVPILKAPIESILLALPPDVSVP